MGHPVLSHSLLILDDFGEGLGVEAGSADEGAVDFRLVEQGDGVVGLDAASVEDADAVGYVAAQAAGDLAADEQVGFGCHLGRGGLAGADGPDGLVGDDDIFRVFRSDTDKGKRDLLAQDFVGVSSFALGEDFADADDGRELVLERGGQLFVHQLIGLVEVLAALGVADDDVRRANGREHENGGFAGVGAFFGPVHVLSADGDVGTGDGGDDDAKRCVRRAEDDLVPVMACDEW